MFDKTYEIRLQEWSDFRATLETAEDPIQLAVNKYAQAPTVSIQADPWDQDTWPTPWELVLENQYCEFCKILGICYSLQLTDRFSASHFEIHIEVDREKGKNYYLLFVDEYVVGYHEDKWAHKTNLPSTLDSQTVYPMHSLN
jgi:hypothetical protein